MFETNSCVFSSTIHEQSSDINQALTEKKEDLKETRAKCWRPRYDVWLCN